MPSTLHSLPALPEGADGRGGRGEGEGRQARCAPRKGKRKQDATELTRERQPAGDCRRIEFRERASKRGQAHRGCTGAQARPTAPSGCAARGTRGDAAEIFRSSGALRHLGVVLMSAMCLRQQDLDYTLPSAAVIELGRVALARRPAPDTESACASLPPIFLV